MAAPDGVERGEQGEARRANTPNDGHHLGHLRLKTCFKSDFSIAQTTGTTYRYMCFIVKKKTPQKGEKRGLITNPLIYSQCILVGVLSELERSAINLVSTTHRSYSQLTFFDFLSNELNGYTLCAVSAPQLFLDVLLRHFREETR